MALHVRKIGYLAMEKHIPTAAALKKAVPGISYETIKHLWDGGAKSTLNVPALNAIARVLGMRTIDLLEEVDD